MLLLLQQTSCCPYGKVAVCMEDQSCGARGSRVDIVPDILSTSETETHREGSHKLVEGELDGSCLADGTHKDGVLAQGLDDLPGWQVLRVLISSDHDDQGACIGLWVGALDRGLNVVHAVLSQLLSNLAALVGTCHGTQGQFSLSRARNNW